MDSEDNKVTYQRILDKFKDAGKIDNIDAEREWSFPNGYFFKLTTDKGTFVLIVDYDIPIGINVSSDKGISFDIDDIEIDDKKVPIKQFMEAKLLYGKIVKPGWHSKLNMTINDNTEKFIQKYVLDLKGDSAVLARLV